MSSLMQSNQQSNRSLAPEWRKSKMGYDFDENSEIWRLDGSITVNLSLMMDLLDDKTSQGFIKALSRYAEELSGPSTKRCLSYLKFYIDATGKSIVDVQGLTNWKASLSDENEYFLGGIKSFLIAWHEWGFPGIDSDVIDYLDELTLKGNVKGKAVRGACPHSGPLTLLEQGSLSDWASNAFTESKINLTEYCLLLSLLFTGRRMGQIRALRACDLVAKEDKNGNDYVVNIPRVKQKGVGFREAFRSLPVIEDLYLLLVNQARASQKLVEQQIGTELSLAVKQQIPIFIEEARVVEFGSEEDVLNALNNIPDYLHISTSRSSQVLIRVSRLNMARSERTGDFIHFTSRRFRYTKGTNLSRRGISGVSLAYALDQSDTQQVGVYTENTVETAQQIDDVMAEALAPLAQAFAGKLIASEKDAIRANDPHSRMKNNASNNVGNCGTHAFCASGYRACYTCVSFQPWRDAPHHEVLEEIITERQRQEKLGLSPNVIQATDRLLLAVKQVILMCKEEKSKTDRGVSND
jgi:integrase